MTKGDGQRELSGEGWGMRKPSGVVRLIHNRTTTLMCIPRPFMRLLRWMEGDHVALAVEGDALVVKNLERHVVALTSPTTRGGDDGQAG